MIMMNRRQYLIAIFLLISAGQLMAEQSKIKMPEIDQHKVKHEIER